MNNTDFYCKAKKTYPEFSLDVSFSLPQGSFTSIIGPSGCGKTTLLQIITGLQEPDEGILAIGGTDISLIPVWERTIALVFQDHALFPHLNVEKNISYSLKLRNINKQKQKQRVQELLDLVGLAGFEARNISKLSGGEKQRVALARALASEPKLLLLDEPFSALDEQLRLHLRDELVRIHKETGITTLYVTHDQKEALAISDTIILMNNGKIEQLGTPQELYKHPITIFGAMFMGTGTLIREEDGMIYFFRPEHAQFSEKLSEDDFFLSNVHITGWEYQGSGYMIKGLWKEHHILIHAETLPEHTTCPVRVQREHIRSWKNTTRQNIDSV